MIIGKIWISIALVLVSAGTNAQEIEHDYTKYLRPLLFVLPKAPEPNDTNPSRKYTAKIFVTTDGTVQLPIELDPPEPAMLVSVNEAARFWLFAPSLSKDCKPERRTGRVNFEYETAEGRAWLEFPKFEVNEGKKYQFDLVDTGADQMQYPTYEARKGITRGTVTVAVKILPDGSSAESVVFIARPRSRGFVETAIKAADRMQVKFRTPVDRPFICVLRTFEFLIQ